MRVAILADRSFAVREREMLARIEVGLADEGVRVVHAIPEAILDEVPLGLYSTLLGYSDAGMSWSRSRRAAELAEAIARAGDGEDAPIDLIHCFGGGCWGLGAELGRRLDAPVLLEVFKAGLVGPAIACVHSGTRRGGPATALAVPGPRVKEAVRKRSAEAGVHVTPWGVHTPETPRDRAEAGVSRAVGLVVEGTDWRWVTAALAGVASVSDRGGGGWSPGGVLAFVSVSDAVAGAVWRQARKLKLLDRLSIVPDLEARREPALQMDALVFAEPGGLHRTLVLEAMAHGVPVAAAADPMVDALVDGRTARLVATSTPEAWAAALADVLTPATAAPLAESARAFVREQRSASAHVARVLGAYEESVGAGKRQGVR